MKDIEQVRSIERVERLLLVSAGGRHGRARTLPAARSTTTRLESGRASWILRWGWLMPPASRPKEKSPSPRRAAALAQYAHEHRSAPTPSEERLWRALRACRLGVRFRRQVVVEGFIVDLLAPAVKLVVEVDGGYHGRRRGADARRDEKLRRAGYRVLRVEAALVSRNLLAAVRSIAGALVAPP